MNTPRCFGAVTIGQAPRPDVTAHILSILGPNYRVVEAGALDGMSAAQIAQLAPQPGEDVLVTRLADGSQVQVAERQMTALVQQKVNGLFGQGLELVVLLCTGHFPGFTAQGKVLRPQELLNQAAAVQGLGRRVGVLCPTPDHIPQMARQWKEVLRSTSGVLGSGPLVRAVSPYHGLDGLRAAAQELKNAGVELAVMDCIAYTVEMQACVQETAGIPVLLPRTLAAEAVKTYLE